MINLCGLGCGLSQMTANFRHQAILGARFRSKVGVEVTRL